MFVHWSLSETGADGETDRQIVSRSAVAGHSCGGLCEVVVQHLPQRSRDGAAILISSHLLHLLEEVCSHVLIVKNGQKVIAMVVTKNTAARRSAEDALAAAITAQGAQGVPGYTVASDDIVANEARVRTAIEASGAAGVVVMRPVAKDKAITSTPSVYTGPMYGPYWGGYYGYANPPPQAQAAPAPQVIVISQDGQGRITTAEAPADYSYVKGCHAIANGYHCDGATATP